MRTSTIKKGYTWNFLFMKDLVEATKFIYYIISKGQSPILEALHMKEKKPTV